MTTDPGTAAGRDVEQLLATAKREAQATGEILRWAGELRAAQSARHELSQLPPAVLRDVLGARR